MARRRGKSSSKQDDSWLPLEPPAGQSNRAFNDYLIPGVILLIIAVGGTGLGWVCSDHQQTIDSLSQTLSSIQTRISKLQQQLGTDNAQLASVGGFEERLVALEDAYAKAQRQVELALATSEQIRSTDLQSKLWSLQAEMNDKLAELQQNTISIAALNTIIKNKSIELEVVKQSVNTMSSTNTELAIQISGFSSMLSVTKLRLDEQIFVMDDLMSQLDGQKRDINEIKVLFDNNQETLASNTQELMDVKELLESEQIKRTQNLEKKLRSLYKRLEDHQMNTESLFFHLTAKVENLQYQFLPGDQQPNRAEKEVQDEEQLPKLDNKEREAPDLKITDEEFAKKKEIREEDGAKEEDELIREQTSVEEVEAPNRPVEEPGQEIQSSTELDVEIKRDVAEEKMDVDITEVVEAAQETDMITDEIDEIDTATVEDIKTNQWPVEEPVQEIQNLPEALNAELEEHLTEEVETIQEACKVRDKLEEAVVDGGLLKDSDPVTVKTKESLDEKVKVPAGEEIQIHSEKASKRKKRTDVTTDADKFQISLKDSSSATDETEDDVMEKEGETDTEPVSEVFSEEHVEHYAEEIHNASNEKSTSDIKTQQDKTAEKESLEIPKPSDETDIDSNENIDDQMRDVIPDEVEQEAVEELTALSAQESVVSEQSVTEM